MRSALQSRIIHPSQNGAVRESAAKRDDLLNLAKAPHKRSPSTPGARHSALLRLAIEGDLRFISHRDTVRMLQRALARAALPVTYSNGFNPHMKLSLLVPRPVGMATEADLALLQLTEPIAAEEIQARLAPQMPSGARLTQAVPLDPGHDICLLDTTYQLELTGNLDDVRQAARRILESDSVIIERRDPKGRPKTNLDLRPFVQDLRIEDTLLIAVAKFRDNHTVAPKDLFTALSLSWNQVRHRVCRRQIGWK